MVGIYKITSPTGRVYIGQSRNYTKRLVDYRKGNFKNQTRLYASVNKYGIDAHIFEVIEECEFEQLNIRERYWQDFYNVLGENGLNCKLTKTNLLPTVVSEETKSKIKVGNTGKKGLKGKEHPSFGKQVPEHRIQKIKEAVKGKNPMLGKHHSEEVKKKISEAKISKNLKGKNSPNYGKKYSEERCKNISASLKGKIRKREDILKTTKFVFIDAVTKEIFIGCAKAVKNLNIKASTLYNIVNGRRENTTNLVLLKDYNSSQ